MSLHLAEAWAQLVGSPLFGVALTLLAYELGRAAWRRSHGHPLTNPVLLGITTVVVVLLVTGVSYQEYWRGASFIAFLLGPATVALAVPLHRQAERVRRAAAPILLSVAVGAVVGLLTSTAVTMALGGGSELALSMAPKSARTPVAIALTPTDRRLDPLTAVLTILTGVIGAVAGPTVLTLLRIRDPRVRGLAIGASSHGIGTARAFGEGLVTGSFSGLAMGLNALATFVAIAALAGVIRQLAG